MRHRLRPIDDRYGAVLASQGALQSETGRNIDVVSTSGNLAIGARVDLPASGFSLTPPAPNPTGSASRLTGSTSITLGTGGAVLVDIRERDGCVGDRQFGAGWPAFCGTVPERPVDGELPTAGQENRTLDRVPEFPHVSRPAMCLELLHRRRFYARQFAPELS